MPVSLAINISTGYAITMQTLHREDIQLGATETLDETAEVSPDSGTPAADARPVIELYEDGETPTPEEAAEKAEEILSVLVALKGGSRREGQVQMARHVAANLVREIPLLAQGGTGIGKSLAYLAGALASGRTGLVATHTKALQDQLVNDLDSLFDQINFQPPVQHALIKGRSAYACLKKVKGGPTEDAPDELFDPNAEDTAPTSKLAQDVVKLHEWVAEQEEGLLKDLPRHNGDRTDVPFSISAKAWEQVSVSADDCLGKGCPFVSECFAEVAKARAAEANIVVANQAMLAMSMAIPFGQIIPDVESVIVDEAHEFASVVADTFGAEVTMKRLKNAVKKCQPLVDAGGKTIEDLQESATNSIEALFASIPVDPKKSRADRNFLTPKVESALNGCRDRFRALFDRSSMMPSGDEAQKATKDRLRRMLSNVISDLELLIAGNGDTQVVWSERNTAFNFTTLHAAQFDVSDTIFEKLIKEYKSVTFTSATMTVGGTFDHIAETNGFNKGPWTSGIAATPFDYQKNAVIYQPAGAPAIKDPGYQRWVVDQIMEVADALGGRTMLLCTAWKAVEESVALIEKHYPGKFNIIAQERDSAFRTVRDRFIAEPNSILVATSTFWTGVSFEGDDCCAVAIDRLPFPSPEEPITAAQSEAADRKFGKWEGFSRVSIPIAAMKMTQGGGRLMRTVNDRGILMIMDPRLNPNDPQYKRMYAKKILDSLPPMPRTHDREKVLEFGRTIRESVAE